MPGLLELGVEQELLGSCLYPGGEGMALERMEEKVGVAPDPDLCFFSEVMLLLVPQVCMARASWVRNFEKPSTSPNSLEPSTTVLSPHLKFGTLSARTLYWRLQDIYKVLLLLLCCCSCYSYFYL